MSRREADPCACRGCGFGSVGLFFLEILGREGVGFSFAPGFLLRGLVRELDKMNASEKRGKDLDLSGLRCITLGGEALVVETGVKFVLEVLKVYECSWDVLVPGFGMTETCAGSQ